MSLFVDRPLKTDLLSPKSWHDGVSTEGLAMFWGDLGVW